MHDAFVPLIMARAAAPPQQMSESLASGARALGPVGLLSAVLGVVLFALALRPGWWTIGRWATS